MAVVGSMVRSVPPGCVPVNYSGIVYQQCGTHLVRAAGGRKFVVVAPPLLTRSSHVVTSMAAAGHDVTG
jgi:hypothetical protein